MSRFWFISAPLPGHLDWGGYLKTARVLAGRGHDVTWISAPPIRPMVEAAGLPFEAIPQTGWLWPLPPTPDLSGIRPDEATRLRYSRALDTWLTEDLIVPAVEALLTLAGSRGVPDAIATDPFLAASSLVAEALDVPLAVCGWPAMPPPEQRTLLPIQSSLAQTAQDRIGRMAARFGLEGRNFARGTNPAVQSPDLHISYFSRYWHQSDSDVLPQTQFVGGMPSQPQDEPPAWLSMLPEGTPYGLATLGTVFSGDLGFLSWAAQGMARIGLVPIVALGRPLPTEEKEQLKAGLPPGTRLLNWVDFDHVLPRLKVIAHHGGMGTTHAAVVHGIPQVIAPHGADQRGQARRAAQAKVALSLSAHDIRQGQLLPGIRAVATDPKVRDTASRLAAQFAALGGPPRAADLIEALVK